MNNKNLRICIFAFIGNIFDHYDLALYGLLLPIFSTIFFPHVNPISSLLKGYAIFPLFFFSRIVGAAFFGKLGDRKGVGISLRYTLFGMAISSLCIGCLPSYFYAKNVASSLFIIAIFVQNFFAAGEKTGGILYILAHMESRKKAILCSLYDVSTVLGYILAASLLYLLTQIGDISVHWRYLYFFSAASLWVGFFIRKNTTIPEKKFTTYKDKISYSRLSCAIFTYAFSYAIYYIFLTFMPSWIPLISEISYQEVIKMNGYLMLLDVGVLPFFGWCAYRWGSKNMLYCALIFTVFCALPTFYFIPTLSYINLFFFRIFWVLLGACFSASLNYWIYTKLSKDTKYLSMALSQVLGSHLGKCAPFLSLMLYQKIGSTLAPAYVVGFFALLAMVSVRKGLSHQKKIDIVPV